MGSIFCCSPMFYPIHISTSTQPWVSSHVVLHSPAFASLNLLPWPAVEAAPLLRQGSVSSSARWRMSPACCHASSSARSSPPMGSLLQWDLRWASLDHAVAGRWPQVSSGASTAVEWLRVVSSDELGVVEDKHGEDEETRSVHNV
jgi:hypothetical protein